MRVLRTAFAVILVLALAGGSFLLLSGARVTVGPPLPRVARGDVVPRPILPKVIIGGAADKPGAIDLVEVPVPVAIAPADDPLARALSQRLAPAIAEAGDVGTSSVLVLDGEGRIVFDLNGAAPLIPASTAKLVTAAAALAAFGPDHSFTTTVAAADRPDADGVLRGDLVLVGGGDPTLVSTAYAEQMIDVERPSTPLEALADAVVATGVTRVEGRIVGDHGYLRGPSLAQGWPDRYLEDLDTTHISGLTIDQGLQLFEQDGALRVRAAPDPAAEAAAALTTALRERGVTVAGEPIAEDLPATAAPVRLASVRSPSLMTLLTYMVQRSDNHIADTLFRAIGRRVEGEGSFGDAETQTRRLLAELQLDFAPVHIADGSGLSRASRLTAGFLTVLNLRMTQSSVGAAWQQLMAVSGESGTLRRRLTGTIAELRLRGKTGSLADVRSLSGAVVGPDGRPLYFTVTSNDLVGAALTGARRLQDLVVLELAAQLYGCVRVPTPAPPTPAPPTTVPSEAEDDESAPSVVPDLPAFTCPAARERPR